MPLKEVAQDKTNYQVYMEVPLEFSVHEHISAQSIADV